MRTNRLYKKSRRNRTVHLQKLTFMFVAVILASLLLGAGKGSVVAHDERTSEPVEYTYYTSIQLSEGDTLWDIAEEYMDHESDTVDGYVDRIMELNDLDCAMINEDCYLLVAYNDTEFK